MRLIAVFIFVLWICVSLPAQAPFGPEGAEDEYNKAKIVTYQRKYSIWDSKPVKTEYKTLVVDLYDKFGNPIQSSTFGNAELRFLYSRTNGILNVDVAYLDNSGKPITDPKFHFQGPWVTTEFADLCSSYFVRTEHDYTRKTQTNFNICRDGTLRNTAVFQLDETDHVISLSRKYPKGLTLDEAYTFDGRRKISTLRYTVSEPERPPVSTVVIYSDTKIDRNGDWASSTVTAFDSTDLTKPTYKYVSRQIITYYD